MFLPFALGYFLSYVFRTVNSIIAPNLTGDLALSAADLGLLTSVYFLAFAAFQLPLGLLLDRFGPRRIQALLVLFAAAGALIFALADGLGDLVLGRALIGLGVSACLMASFKAFVLWFPPSRLALVNSALLALGATGALAATLPVEWGLQFVGWRGLFLSVAGLAVVVALLVALVVPEHHDAPVHSSLAGQWRGLTQVLSSRFFWRVTPLAFLSQGAFLALQGLWAGPWLRDVAGLARQQVAGELAGLALSIVVGFVVFGGLADRLSRYGIKPLTVATVGMALFVAAQLGLVLQPPGWGLPLWLAFGFFGTSSTLAYAVLSQAFPAALAGRVNTALNLLVFLTAFLMQWGIGAVLHHWEDPVSRLYDPQGYAWGFAIVAGLQLLALVWLLVWNRE